MTGVPLVEVRRDGGVAILTLNRPHRRNAATEALQDALLAELEAVAADPAARVLVLAGAGPDFCVGGDHDLVARLAADDALRAEVGAVHDRIARALLGLAIPTIAAIEGRAFGFGAELAAFSDMVVMAENASLADTHVKLGLDAAPGVLLLWPQLAPRAIAMELMLTGRTVSAHEALQLGLANRLAPAGGAVAAACDLAAALAALPPGNVQSAKRALRRSYDRMLADAGMGPSGADG